MAERLGKGLQNLVQRFDSASDLPGGGGKKKIQTQRVTQYREFRMQEAPKNITESTKSKRQFFNCRFF